MESMNACMEKEQVRKLERVFQIFARAQEDWAMAHDLCKSTGDRGKDIGASAYGVQEAARLVLG